MRVVRETFAHDAVLAMDPDGDEHAPGGAITVALCGSWSHEPPCPLAPHHTHAHRSGPIVTLRLLFAAEPEAEPQVRRLVEETLRRGWGDGPDGHRTAWNLVTTAPSPLRPDEEDHGRRLIHS